MTTTPQKRPGRGETSGRIIAGRSTWIAVAFVALALVVVAPATAEAQCAMCRTALDSPAARELVAALRSGILLLLAAPFAVFGVVAWVAIRGQRRLAADTTPTGAHTGEKTA